ncbi:cellulase family glycosylhydrolase [Massilia pseudoviolaceinigra]|uniref:cellulase family glycosylhydrolase n=1 Tax=Massilia pseudoviolaceinigra TaxID=3057165 RepID=UPI002796B109|nr:cellulase family glycosylhydrolase [Massilia sp. CCM 9206]MDQ1919019.1 carbohydrate-binding protein [Massilia sp. CCM 9206]
MSMTLSNAAASRPTFRTTLIALALSLCAGAALADVPALSVSGNQVLVGGKPGSISGSSMYWSNTGWPGERFYNAGAVGWLKDDWKARLVRAAMGVEEPGGYIQFPAANKARVKAVVDAAIAKDMYVIIDWHSHYAFRHQNEAIAFFQEMARTYGNNKHVIYEIYNEPKDDVTWDAHVKPYAQAVIAAIRAIDPDNLIIVGSPHWSQDADIASRNPITGHSNIAYTLHFYAGTHGQFLREKAATAMNNGLALFVTEWGSVNADGNGGVNYPETNAWIDFMKKHNISNANWALDDAREGSASLVPGASATGGWANWDLTESGKQARETVRFWPSTSDTGCTTATVPATIQAEAYCQMSGVRIESTGDAGGGQNVGYIDSGDWMNYTVDVPSAGLYTVSYRVASANGGGNISLERAGGSPVFGTKAVAATGGWQTWSTISHDVQLPAGKQSIGIAAKAGGFNLNWISIAAAGSGGQIALIQAEDHASMSGVESEQTSDAGGGRNASHIDSGDWMSYTNAPVVIPESGAYTIEFRVASPGGGELSFEEAGGKPTHATVAIPATGGWQNWASVNKTVTLAAGSHSFGIYAKQGGWNLNWIKVSKGAR